MAILRYVVGLDWDGPGSPGVNVFHARLADESEITTATEVRDVLVAFYTALLSHYNSTTRITVGQQVLDIETQEDAGVAPVVLTGTGGTGEAPQLLQLVVSWKTAVSARRGMGRTFIGPVTSGTLQTDGTPTALFRDAVQAAANQLIADSVGLTFAALGVWGYQNAAGPGGRLESDPRVLRDFQSAVVADKWAYLSSRRD